MLTLRRCCCEEGADCFPPCVSCGGGNLYNWAVGTATDDNGVWVPRWYPGLTEGVASGVFTSSPVLVSFGVCDEAEVEYVAFFVCDREEGKVSARVGIGATTEHSCEGEDVVFQPLYLGSTEPVFSEWSDVTPSSCDPLMATFSFTKAAGYPAYLDLPTTSMSISIPVATGTGDICAGPCKIPGKNLTLSWTNTISGPGSITLVWNGSLIPGVVTWSTTSGPWSTTGSTGWATLSIDTPSFETKFTMRQGATGWVCVPSIFGETLDPIHKADWVCSPYHLHLSPSADPPTFTGDCPNLLALGYTNFYIDE